MKGYEQLAVLTSEFDELLLLRRFDKMSCRILLRRQAELLHLEQELEIFIEGDEIADPDLTRSFKYFRNAADAGKISLQVEKYSEVELKLKTYYETILRLRDIRNMSRPSRRNRARLWEWLCSPEGGDHFLQSKTEAGPWESAKIEELLTLSPQRDRLDAWLSDAVMPVYHHLLGHRAKPNVDVELGLGRLWLYKTTWLHAVGDLLCVILSSVVPVASIQGLYWIQSTLGRLFMITGAIVLFSALLMFVAGCRRSEVFAATIAFAAVLVVFLQGLNGAINSS